MAGAFADRHRAQELDLALVQISIARRALCYDISLVQMSIQFETTMGWHEKVHRHLGEELCYFFVKVSPFDEAKIKVNLEKMFKHRQIGRASCRERV